MGLKHLIWPITFLFAGVIEGQTPQSARTWIPLIVETSHHALVLNLSPESLVITENKVQATDIRLLGPAELPLRLGILIDVSNSERDRNFPKLFAAAKDFAARALRGAEDRVFFMKFDATPEDTGWITRDQILGVPETQRAGGVGTAIYDSVVSACVNRIGAADWSKPARRVLVLISDGEDNQSHVGRDVALTDAIQEGVVIFAFDNGTPGGDTIMLRGDTIMEDFAKVSKVSRR